MASRGYAAYNPDTKIFTSNDGSFTKLVKNMSDDEVRHYFDEMENDHMRAFLSHKKLVSGGTKAVVKAHLQDYLDGKPGECTQSLFVLFCFD
jgi:flavorubredoxin